MSSPPCNGRSNPFTLNPTGRSLPPIWCCEGCPYLVWQAADLPKADNGFLSNCALNPANRRKRAADPDAARLRLKDRIDKSGGIRSFSSVRALVDNGYGRFIRDPSDMVWVYRPRYRRHGPFHDGDCLVNPRNGWDRPLHGQPEPGHIEERGPKWDGRSLDYDNAILVPARRRGKE